MVVPTVSANRVRTLPNQLQRSQKQRQRPNPGALEGECDQEPRFAPGMNMSSIRIEKTAAMTKASGKLGSYFPCSIEMTVWRDTASFSARYCCDQPFASRSSRTRFFIGNGGQTTSHQIRREIQWLWQ